MPHKPNRATAMTNNEHRTCDHFDWRRAYRSCRRTVSAAAASRAPAGAEPLDPQYLPEFRNQSALHLHERIPPVLVLIYGGPRRPRRDLLAPGWTGTLVWKPAAFFPCQCRRSEPATSSVG